MSDADTRGDWQLFDEWRAGDGDAGDRLLLRYFGLLTRFFYTKARAEDVGDLVAETYLACTSGINRLEPGGSFRSLLFAIAMNKLRHYYRTQGKRRRETDDFNAVCVAESLATPTSWLSRHAETRLLVRALRRLPLNQQIVLELSYFEGLHGPEIAELLELPLATVYTLLRRGKARLAELVHELSESPRLAESTMMGLETWALKIRAHISD